MKILYLLFAVFFLVLQDAPEFSQAENPSLQCRLHGGDCYLKRCPSDFEAIGICDNYQVCCK
ncbi:unnamed protein product, partial [Natator depressus]